MFIHRQLKVYGNTFGSIIDFPANNNNNISFKFKGKITEETENHNTKDVDKMVA